MATQLARQDAGGMTLAQAQAQFRGQLEQRAKEFQMVLPAHITPEKLQRTILTAVQSDPDLLRADRQSLILACMKAAQDGLLPDKREAALVIFNENKKDAGGQWMQRKLVQYMPMVFGLRKKILQSGEISAIETNVVYRAEAEAGHFIFEAGTEAMLRHRPMLDLSDEQVADDQIIAAYSVAVMKDGTKSFEVMRRSEINKVREKSQTGATKDRRGQARKASGPWVDWFGEMARKTVMRRHSKTLPMSGDILDVEAADDELYSRSATSVLGAVEADAPQTLPSRDDFADQGGTVAEQTDHDPVTGEIGEEAARAADSEGFAAMDGRSDEQHGDQHEGADEATDDDAAEPQVAEHSPRAAFTKRLIADLGKAKDKEAIKAVDDEFVKHRAAMDEADVALIEGELRNARRALIEGVE